MSEPIRHPLDRAQAVADKWIELLTPFCDRIAIAGSIRRRKPFVKDVEIIYIPQMVEASPPGSLFPERVSAVDMALHGILERGHLTRRLSRDGRPTWGPKNKLTVDTLSGVPVDFFSTTAAAWYSYLICRTGSAQHNIRLAARAQSLGYKWHPYSGLETPDDHISLESEEHLYQLLKLPYLKPEARLE